MSFPITFQKLSSQFLEKIPVPYSSNDVTTECIRKKSVCRSSPNLTDLKFQAKLPSSRRNVQGCFANASFNADQCPTRGKLAIKMAHSKSFDDLPEQYDCPSPGSSSKGDYYDYTQIKPTYTSNARCKLARNEPIPSHYYNEHMELYGKPPFVWGVRKSSDYEDAFKCRRPIRKCETIY